MHMCSLGLESHANSYGVAAEQQPSNRKLTLPAPAHYSQRLSMGVSKIQIGQLWKKDGTRDIYLVTRLYTEALSTMVVMRKSGAEGEALIRVRAERNSTGHNIPGFSPAQEEEKL
jgi:hypothetical protein